MDNEPQSPKTRKDSRVNTLVLVIGVIVLGSWMALAGRNRQQCGCSPFSPGCAPQTASPARLSDVVRPRLLDLGATKCVPCKMMAPILDELKEEYAGRLDVEFIDVWQYPDVGREYGIESIPAQIFFDATGKEVYRHQGFFAKEDILKKWKELGVDLTK